METALNRLGIRYKTIYLDIDKETMEYRLGMLRRQSVKVIEERKKDFTIFSSKGFDYVIDGKASFAEVYRTFIGILKRNKFVS